MRAGARQDRLAGGVVRVEAQSSQEAVAVIQGRGDEVRVREGWGLWE